MDARQRLAAFLAWVGWTQDDLARQVGCHQTLVSKILAGKRDANLHFAHAVETITSKSHVVDGVDATFPGGPICTEHWDPTAAAQPRATGTEG